MKTILAAAVLSLSALTARAGTLQETDAACLLHGIFGPNPVEYEVYGVGPMKLSWKDLDEATYCPYVIERTNEYDKRALAEQEAQRRTDLRRYGASQ
jgi:hypothetical protein